MTTQYSTAHRTNSATQLNTDIGMSAKLKFYSGAVPANVAAAAGTLGATLTGNATAFGAAAAGVLTANAITGANAAAAMAPCTYMRIATLADVDVVQLLVFQQVVLATNALTAANGNVLNFAATTGVLPGMNVAGTGIPVGTTVLSVTSTTVVLSQTSAAGVASAASITFNGDCTLQNTSINIGQAMTVSSLTITTAGA